MTDRLYRSPTDRVIAGVAGGLATWLNLDPSLVRIAWVLLAVFSGGIFVLVYIVMMIVVPLPPPGWIPQRPAGGAPGAWPGAGPAAGGWTPGAPPPPGTTWSPGWDTRPPSPGWDPASLGSGRASIAIGTVLIVLGAWLLLQQFLDIDAALVGPALVILVGVGLIVAAMTRNRPSA